MLRREAAVRAEAQAQAEEVVQRVAADLVHTERVWLEPMQRGRCRFCSRIYNERRFVVYYSRRV
jgi:hypothetical protein